MNNILVPIDFSICCYNAFRFGLHLAEATGRNLLVVHYRTNRFSTQDAEHAVTINRMEQFVQSENHLRDFDFEELPESVKIRFEANSVDKPAAAIKERAEQSDVDMVVMGSKTLVKTVGTWYGSTSIRVSSACDRPVFLIPPTAKFVPFKQVVVANSFEVATPYPLWQIEELAGIYQSKVHFLHIDNPDQETSVRFTPWRLMDELAGKEPKVSYPFVVSAVSDNDISKGILDYGQDIDASLIVVVNDLNLQDNRVFHKTLTQIPLLVLHTEMKPA